MQSFISCPELSKYFSNFHAEISLDSSIYFPDNKISQILFQLKWVFEWIHKYIRKSGEKKCTQ